MTCLIPKQMYLMPLVVVIAVAVGCQDRGSVSSLKVDANPLFSLDQIGVELQNPFAKVNLSHLPLDDISTTIEENLTGLLTARHNPATEPKLDNTVSDAS